jgi:hypothetical protein
MDISSFLWGAAIGVVGSFATGFLKKAGEDSYSWAKKKIDPNSSNMPESHLIIHMNSDVPKTMERSIQNGDSSRLERVSQITADEIRSSVEDAPPLQRDRIANSYIGLRVEWDTEYTNGSKLDNGHIKLQLSPFGKIHTSVWCEVPEDEYRELAILPNRSKIRVYGEIESVGDHGIYIGNAQLHIYPRAK